MFFIVQLSATTVPPVSLTIPLGAPVVPDVSKSLISSLTLTKDVERMISFYRYTLSYVLLLLHELIVVIVYLVIMILIFILVSSLDYDSLDCVHSILYLLAHGQSLIYYGSVVNHLARFQSA
jgi:hypothetical protein